MFMQGGGGVLANGWDCLGIKTYKVNIHPARVDVAIHNIPV